MKKAANANTAKSIARKTPMLASILCSFNLLAACPSAPTIFENLYKYDYDFAFKDPTQLITPFSTEFNNLLRQEFLCKKGGDSCKIDWDPWTNAQDGKIIKFPTIEKIEEKEKFLQITATLVFASDSENDSKNIKITIQMKRRNKNSCWHINDFKADDYSSMLEILKN